MARFLSGKKKAGKEGALDRKNLPQRLSTSSNFLLKPRKAWKGKNSKGGTRASR